MFDQYIISPYDINKNIQFWENINFHARTHQTIPRCTTTITMCGWAFATEKVRTYTYGLRKMRNINSCTTTLNRSQMRGRTIKRHILKRIQLTVLFWLKEKVLKGVAP